MDHGAFPKGILVRTVWAEHTLFYHAYLYPTSHAAWPASPDWVVWSPVGLHVVVHTLHVRLQEDLEMREGKVTAMELAIEERHADAVPLSLKGRL